MKIHLQRGLIFGNKFTITTRVFHMDCLNPRHLVSVEVVMLETSVNQKMFLDFLELRFSIWAIVLGASNLLFSDWYWESLFGFVSFLCRTRGFDCMVCGVTEVRIRPQPAGLWSQGHLPPLSTPPHTKGTLWVSSF
jgi:hypothetical protein